MLNEMPILRRPLITEKTTRLRENNKYVIEVQSHATKGQIKQQIESQFGVTVLNVNTLKSIGKFRRRTGPLGGYQPTRKKAIVQLKQGQKITWEEAK